jgi:hypothetical protein
MVRRLRMLRAGTPPHARGTPSCRHSAAMSSGRPAKRTQLWRCLMGLWLWDEDPCFSMSPADTLTTLAAAAIAAGVIEPPRVRTAQVIDFNAVRLARLGEQGPDA